MYTYMCFSIFFNLLFDARSCEGWIRGFGLIALLEVTFGGLRLTLMPGGSRCLMARVGE